MYCRGLGSTDPRVGPRPLREGARVVSSQVQVTEVKRKAFFTERLLADYLSLSPRTVREMLQRGDLPSYKIGGSRRIDPVDVDRFLSRCRQEAA